jgi:hypothetical protein
LRQQPSHGPATALPTALQGELLCSCLALLLAAPHALLDACHLGPAVAQALGLGLQYVPLAAVS